MERTYLKKLETLEWITEMTKFQLSELITKIPIIRKIKLQRLD